MSEMFEVVQGVPLRQINRTPKGVRRKYPIDKMGVGDWFFVAGREVRSVSAYISRISKDLPGKYSARKDWAKQNAEGKWRQCDAAASGAVQGVGVWRTE